MRQFDLKFTILLCLVVSLTLAAKDKLKPWNEWSKKDAQKILDDSSWGQTQVLTDRSKVGLTPSTAIQDLSNAARLNYRIRLISARPIRLAMLRLAQLDTRVKPEGVKQLQDFVNMKFDDVIVVGVTFDSDQPRVMGSAIRSFNSGITSMLANTTYLDVNGRPRNFLREYQPPSTDGLGAKFVFARLISGHPFIDAKSATLRFYAKFPQLAGDDAPVELDWRFKVSGMMYDGILEY